MKIRYTIEIITTGRTPKKELDLTLKELRSIPGTKIEDYDSRDNSAFIEVVYDAPLQKQIDFSVRFLPTIFEVESKIDDIEAKEFWQIIMNVSQRLHKIAPLTYGQSVEPKRSKPTQDEYEKLILEDRYTDVIFTIPTNANAAPYYSSSIVIDETVKNGFRALRLIGPIGKLVEAVMITPPVLIYPVAPETYDFRIDELQDVLQTVTEVTRYGLSLALKRATHSRS